MISKLIPGKNYFQTGLKKNVEIFHGNAEGFDFRKGFYIKLKFKERGIFIGPRNLPMKKYDQTPSKIKPTPELFIMQSRRWEQ